MIWQTCRCVCVGAVFLIAGCGGSAGDVSKERLTQMAGGTLKDVVPVSGTVSIDGSPATGVNIYLYAKTAPPGERPIRHCRTGADGKYCWSTNTSCDGIEPGEYKLAFLHLPKGKDKRKEKDLLNGRYEDPSVSEFSLTVELGKPQKDVDYILSTK